MEEDLCKECKKNAAEKRLHHKKQISKGVLFKEYKTQTGSVTSAVKEMQLYSLDQCDVAIGPLN